ncbi:MAG: helix-turn-helix transcriptional regulator [Clostridia bacterium]|nr:helix-turn-helix transcriptional regulator [Clostridia bacterium]
MENKELINKAIGFIQSNPKDNLSLQRIAENAGFSLTYFDAMFKHHTGYSPVEYSRVYKLTRSALELRKTEKTILDIALDFGYSSPESYTRAFKSFYSLTPSEYREKYSDKPIGWQDLSGKISINNFKRSFPELKVSDLELALDFCFTHNPLKYAEDMVNMTVTETEILTLGDPEHLEHFLFVSDYDYPEPAVMLICENEEDAIPYVKLFAKDRKLIFSVRRPADEEWERFDAEIAKSGRTCKFGYDMMYTADTVDVPKYDGMSVRELNENHLSSIKAFKDSGGCAECHVRAIQLHFSGKGNPGMRPLGIFENGNLICIALPYLDKVRELNRYDIGAIFSLNSKSEDKAIELIWKYAIHMCLKEGAVIGNANAFEGTYPLSIAASERMGLIKVAKNCGYAIR